MISYVNVVSSQGKRSRPRIAGLPISAHSKLLASQTPAGSGFPAEIYHRKKSKLKLELFSMVTSRGILWYIAPLQASCGQYLTPHGFKLRILAPTKKKDQQMLIFFLGEPRGIFLEHLFVDLFTLRERFRDLGMVIKDGKVFLSDLEEKDV